LGLEKLGPAPLAIERLFFEEFEIPCGYISVKSSMSDRFIYHKYTNGDKNRISFEFMENIAVTAQKFGLILKMRSRITVAIPGTGLLIFPENTPADSLQICVSTLVVSYI
jgi:hypothetical protein